MSAEQAKRIPTYDDLLALPDHVVGELVAGELHVSPRPASLHARAASRISIKVGAPFDSGDGGGPGGWIILVEPELHLGEDVLVPDLAGWRRERMPELPNTAAFELAPDWICEVFSPRTAMLDRGKKMPAYARAGVGFAWLVDPVAQTLESYRRMEHHWLLLGTFSEGHARVEPFEAIELEVAAFWER